MTVACRCMIGGDWVKPGAVVIDLHFWTFATDFFDTSASRRLFPYLAVGASAGGILGGL